MPDSSHRLRGKLFLDLLVSHSLLVDFGNASGSGHSGDAFHMDCMVSRNQIAADGADVSVLCLVGNARNCCTHLVDFRIVGPRCIDLF